ncbi:MAG TPA: sulfatase [Pirellulales bacterium]|jgi:arylsulfatase A-like enzyme|nr:sulfatase [Pirellulales bacterium]
MKAHVLTLLLTSLGIVASAGNMATAKPNILWIIAEDMGPDLACYGRTDLATPNLDRLAAQGCRYTRAFSSAPICSAARSGLMTGAYPTSFGANNHRSNRQRGAAGLPPNVKLLCDRFRAAGYFTANITRFPAGTDLEGKGKTDWNFAYPGREFDTADWQDLKSHQPFFAQVNLPEAHRVYHKDTANPVDPAKVALPPYLADHPLVREDWAAYLDAIQILDTKVGKILDLLQAQGLADTTIVMFIGDNGREDFRGKYQLFEQGCSVPLLVRAPGIVAPGSVSGDLISGVDIAATSLSLTGIELPEGFDGKPFLGPHRQRREYLFTALDRIDENFDQLRAVRDARWKYVRNFEPDRPYLQPSAYRSTTNPTFLLMQKLHAEGKLNAAQQQFLASSRPAEALYDLEADPYEFNNLAALPQYAGELKRLRSELDAWMQHCGDKPGRTESKESEEFSLKKYAASRPGVFAQNIDELRQQYRNLSEIEPMLRDAKAAAGSSAKQ